MAIPYVVRKKADLTSGERKELWYAVPKKLQQRGGIKNKELASRMEKTSGFHRGQIEGILSELVYNVRHALSMGESVTLEGLGTFHTALTSEGFEHPEEVTPGKVSVSRVYFVAHPDFRKKVKDMKCARIPFSYYMDESVLTKGMRRADREQETYNQEGSQSDEESQL